MRSHEPVVIHCHVVVRLRTVRGPGDLAHLPSGRRRLVVRSHVDHAGMRRLREEVPGFREVPEHRYDVLPPSRPAREGLPDLPDAVVGVGFDAWVAGYGTTESIDLGTFSYFGSGQVQTVLSALQTSGAVYTYTGTYTVQNGIIVAAHIVQD